MIMKCYEKKVYKEIDKNKKTSLFFITNFCSFCDGFIEVLLDYRKNRDENIVVFGNSFKDIKDRLQNYANVVYENRYYLTYSAVKDSFKDEKDYDKFFENFKDDIKTEISKYKIDKIFWQGPIFAGLNVKTIDDYFFDGDDDDDLEKIAEKNLIFNKNIDDKMSTSLKAFMMSNTRTSILVSNIIMRQNQMCKFYYFVNDPRTPWDYFDYKYGERAKVFYFENDFRGTRRFHEFPMAQLHHLVWEKQFIKEKKSLFSSKNKLLCFIGNFMTSYIRHQSYYKFFHNLKLSNSAFFSKVKTEDKCDNEEELKVLTDIKNSPYFNPYLEYESLNATLRRYKYALIVRCLTRIDSLNFRIYMYLAQDVLPIVDYEYDPTFKQIPSDFYDFIGVKDSTGIEERIKFFEEHPEAYRVLLDKMKKYYEIDSEVWKDKTKLYNMLDKYFI